MPVGEYARQLKRELQALPRATITGELTELSRSRVQIYFELRDERGGVRGTMWLNEFNRLGLPEGSFKIGAEVVVTGGPDYYEGGKTASPSFSFRATDIRLSGEGDLLARLDALRRQFAAEGLMDLQKRLYRPVLPRRIGVITAERGAARDDLVAGLERRGWSGEIVWGFAPVQDRKAAPEITRILSDMAAFGNVETIVVSRGGGSLTDLWAFCDETLCRTVALLGVPVVSAVGHERDETLIDDVAAARCSTPTHAADEVIRVDCRAERESLKRRFARVADAGPAAIRRRAVPLARLAAGPGRALRQERAALNQRTREISAAGRRRGRRHREDLATGPHRRLIAAGIRAERSLALALEQNSVLPGRIAAAAHRLVEARRKSLGGGRVTVDAHDPQRVLERGYARVDDRRGEPVTSPDAARQAGEVRIRFAAGSVDATVGKVHRSRRSRGAEKGADRKNEFEQITLEGVESDE